MHTLYRRYSSIKILGLIVFSIGFLQALGCGTSRGEFPTHSPENASRIASQDPVLTKADLEKAMDKWSTTSLLNYKIVVRLKTTGFVPPAEKVTITVTENQSAAIDSMADQKPVALYQNFDDIRKIFREIEKQLDLDREVRGVFNPDYGYPKRLYVLYPDRSSGAYEFYIDEFIPAA
jgi:Family of unknown function (DUF6174)